MRRFLYFYLMGSTVDIASQAVPAHVQYWKSRDVLRYEGGPFADRTGGVITFQADSLEDARHIAEDDPFLREDMAERAWVKECLVD